MSTFLLLQWLEEMRWSEALLPKSGFIRHHAETYFGHIILDCQNGTIIPEKQILP